MASLGSATANINNNCDTYGYNSCDTNDHTTSNSNHHSTHKPKVFTFGEIRKLNDTKKVSNITETLNQTEWDLKNDTELAEYQNETVNEVIQETVEEIDTLQTPTLYLIIFIVVFVILIMGLFIYRTFIKEPEINNKYEWDYGLNQNGN